VNDAMAFLCLTMQACGGMQREGGEGEGRTGACCEEGREVGNGREIPTSVIIKGMRGIFRSHVSAGSAEIFD